MSAVVQTGSSEARSACGTKVIVFVDWAPTTRGAASATALASVDLRRVRRFIGMAPRISLQKLAAHADVGLSAAVSARHSAKILLATNIDSRMIGTPT